MTMERDKIIEYLKEIDPFFTKVNFEAYSLTELKKIKERWEALPVTEYNKLKQASKKVRKD
jgi:hypothetical protein